MAELATFIADNLTTNDNTKLAPASQAFALKALIDAQATAVANKATTAQLTTEQARILVLETSQSAQDTAIGLRSTQTALDIEKTRILAIETSQGTQDIAIGLRATQAALDTEKSRILALETSQGTQDTAIGLRATQLSLDAEKARILALEAKVSALESGELTVSNTVQSGNFNATLGKTEPFRIDTANALCTPPATGALMDGVEFGVVLYGTPGGGFSCTVDFQTSGQALHGRTGANANVIITTEVTPFKVRWNATLASWFIVS
jgi:hypothetical protein